MQTNNAVENTQENPHQLSHPIDFGDFQLVSGNLHNASVALIIIDRIFQKTILQSTFSCLAALALLPSFSKGYNVHLEGNSNAQIARKTKSSSLCHGAIECLSWNNVDYSFKVKEIETATTFLNVIYFILEFQRKNNIDDIKMCKLLLEPKFETTIMSRFYDISGPMTKVQYKGIISQLKDDFKKNQVSKLDNIFKLNLEGMQKTFELPVKILEGETSDVVNAIRQTLTPQGGVISLFKKARVQGLREKIDAVLSANIGNIFCGF